MRSIEQINGELTEIARKCRFDVAAVQADDGLPDGARMYKTADVRKAYHEQAKDLQAEAEGLIANREAKLRQHMASSYIGTKDVDKVAAAWQRAEKLLDAGVSVEEILERATERGDKATIAAVDQEIGTWAWAKSAREGQSNPTAGDYLKPAIDWSKYQTGPDGFRNSVEELHDLQSNAAYAVRYNASAVLTDTNPNHSDAGKAADAMLTPTKEVVNVPADGGYAEAQEAEQVRQQTEARERRESLRRLQGGDHNPLPRHAIN